MVSAQTPGTFSAQLEVAWFVAATVGEHFEKGDSREILVEKSAAQTLIAIEAPSILVRALAHHCNTEEADAAIGVGSLGFSTKYGALWYRRDQIGKLVKSARRAGVPLPDRLPARKTFDVMRDRGQFTRKTCAFLKSDVCERWEASKTLDASAFLDAVVAEILRGDAKVDAGRLPFAGFLIGGACNGVNWIGLRSRDVIADYVRRLAPEHQNKPLWEALRLIGPIRRAMLLAPDAHEHGKRRANERFTEAGKRGTEVSVAKRASVLRESSDWLERIDQLKRKHEYDLHLLLDSIVCFQEANIPTSIAALRRFLWHTGGLDRRFSDTLARLQGENWLIVKGVTESHKETGLFDPEEDWFVELPGAVRRAVLAGMTADEHRTWLSAVVSWAVESPTILTPIRLRLLYSHLAHDAFEHNPQRPLELLVELLPHHDLERVQCAMRLAPINPSLAADALRECHERYPDADHWWPECVQVCAERRAPWSTVIPFMARAAAEAPAYTKDVIEHLVNGDKLRTQFATAFRGAIESISKLPDNTPELIDTVKLWVRSGDNQVWLIWVAVLELERRPDVARQWLNAVDVGIVSTDIRAYYDQSLLTLEL
jgi:hypothetical protein